MSTADQTYLAADSLVRGWMLKYKMHLLDGDPNVVHPKARAELTLLIAEAMTQTAKLAKGEPSEGLEFVAEKKAKRKKADGEGE